ncbi:MAG: hypothetical protein ACEQSR_08575 [Candidatus Methylacidiphilales bacterium]
MSKIEIIYYSLSVLFLFRIFLYAIGDPHNDKPNAYAILFSWPYFLAYIVLKKYNLLDQFKPFFENENLTIEQKKDLRLMVFQKGKKHFTWQMVFGMCGVCTFFWVSLFLILIPNFNLFGIFIFSTINFLNKIILKWT